MISENVLKIVDDGIILRLRISPNSSKNQFIFADEMIKLKITAQPIENKANKALIEFLSKTLQVAKSNIEIVKCRTYGDLKSLIERKLP